MCSEDFPGLASDMQGAAKAPPHGASFTARLESALWGLRSRFSVCCAPKGRQLVLAAVSGGERQHWEAAWVAAGQPTTLPADALAGLQEAAECLQQEFSALLALPRGARRKQLARGL